MVVLVVLLSVFTVTWGLLAITQRPRQIRTAGCIAFAALFIFTGISHFALAEGMVKMLPEWVPGRYPIIYITGIMEIILGLGFFMAISPTYEWSIDTYLLDCCTSV